MTEEKKPSFAEASKDKGGKELNIEGLRKKLEEYQKQKEEYLDGWKRERADFLNYKKEEMERIDELIKYADEEFILKILPILDNFEIAIKEIQNSKSPEGQAYGAGKIQNFEEIIKGFLQIKSQISDFLKSQGVEEIKTLGQKFDPNFQEVVEEVETKDKEPGTVVEEVKKGYTLYGRVLRPAKVKISK